MTSVLCSFDIVYCLFLYYLHAAVTTPINLCLSVCPSIHLQYPELIGIKTVEWTRNSPVAQSLCSLIRPTETQTTQPHSGHIKEESNTETHHSTDMLNTATEMKQTAAGGTLSTGILK